VHVPGVVPSHASHGPSHARLQQSPSTHEPLAHSAFAVHVRPFFFLQVPAASQVLVPVHELGSSALVTTTHAPVPAAQDMQVAAHAAAQQTPWSQMPVAQSSSKVQLVPGALTLSSSASPTEAPGPPSRVRPPVASTMPLSRIVAARSPRGSPRNCAVANVPLPGS
jgi:hypothetical protein